jgi:hypothetical protein
MLHKCYIGIKYMADPTFLTSYIDLFPIFYLLIMLPSVFCLNVAGEMYFDLLNCRARTENYFDITCRQVLCVASHKFQHLLCDQETLCQINFKLQLDPLLK